MENREFINQHGLFVTIITAIIGVQVFSYPRQLALAVGTDGWIIALMQGIIGYFLIYITYKVIMINNCNNFYNIIMDSFGKIIGFIVSIIFIAYNLMFISVQMRIFVEVLRMYLLERTPTEFIIIVTILMGSYVIRGNIDDLVKFNEITFWVMVCAILFIILFTLNKADFTNLLPIFNNKPIDYIRGLQSTIYSFSGFQIIYLLLPFIKNKKDTPKTALKSIIFITTFYIITVIFTLAIFDKEQTKILLWPTVTMIKSINIPGAFIERWDGIVMTLWVVFYFTTFANIYYLTADIVKDTFKLGDIKFSPVIIAPFIYIMAIYSANIADVYEMSARVNNVFGFMGLILLPLLLYLIGKFKMKKVRRVSK